MVFILTASLCLQHVLEICIISLIVSVGITEAERQNGLSKTTQPVSTSPSPMMELEPLVIFSFLSLLLMKSGISSYQCKYMYW